mmetsp:Transcript_10803/g.28918  ORF Transcript_10803/g.28918 Transcript_10803/m.28918 type:complete len:214 (-) Transcript_10803:1167-1808(-)
MESALSEGGFGLDMILSHRESVRDISQKLNAAEEAALLEKKTSAAMKARKPAAPVAKKAAAKPDVTEPVKMDIAPKSVAAAPTKVAPEASVDPVSKENVAPANATKAESSDAKSTAPAAPEPKADAAQPAETEIEICWTAEHPVEKTIELTGSFLKWTDTVEMMAKDGVWSAVVKLPKGKHEFKFIVDGEWMYDLTQPHEPDETGNYNNVIEV